MPASNEKLALGRHPETTHFLRKYLEKVVEGTQAL